MSSQSSGAARFLSRQAELNVLLLGLINALLCCLVAIFVVVPIMLIVGKPKNDELVEVISQMSTRDVLLLAVVIGPLWETLVFQWLPLVIASALIGRLCASKLRPLGWILVAVTASVFALVHGWNSSTFEWRQAIGRLPTGIFLSAITFIQLAYLSGSRSRRRFRAFAAALVTHSTFNGIFIGIYLMLARH